MLSGHLLKAVMPATNSSLVISPSELISRAASGKQHHADGSQSVGPNPNPHSALLLLLLKIDYQCATPAHRASRIS